MKNPLASTSLLCLACSVCLGVTRSLPAQGDLFGEPQNLSVNIEEGDWIDRPTLTEDGLTLYYDVYDDQGSWFDLFIMKATRATTAEDFQGGVRLGPEVNALGIWIAGPSISPDGLTLYYTRWPDADTTDIWVAAKTAPNAEFGPGVPLAALNTPGLEHPGCVSADGEELFFVRNFDLWAADFLTPGEPREGFRNVRELVALNTDEQAYHPSLSADGRFLLWSDRPQDLRAGGPPRPCGHGSADIWMAARERLADRSWGPFGEPVNLPEPVNTGPHEISPWLTSDALFFASTRNGWGQTLYATPLLQDLSDIFAEVAETVDPDECFEVVEPPVVFVRGDSNGDGHVDLADAVTTIDALFVKAVRLDCQDASDSNDDGAIDIADAINTLNVLFAGKGRIPIPGMIDCGGDPTPDALGCGRECVE